MRARASALLVLLAAAGCSPLEEPPSLEGEYPRGTFHLYLWCKDLTPQFRALDLLYPRNGAGATWRFEQSGYDVTVDWGGVPIAHGRRTTEGLDLTFERLDPFSSGDTLELHHAQLRDDLVFHDRTIVGRISSGTVDGCVVLPDSVLWMTAGDRDPAPELAQRAAARAPGDWSRFVWFLDVGPYGMTRKGDLGQRGRNLRLFSFATTGGGAITAGDDVTFFDNGFGENWIGATEAGAARFSQPQEYWDLDYRQEVLYDSPGNSPGIHRVLSGFVGGRYRLTEQSYPFGWDGETGMLPLTYSGMAFWLDMNRIEEPAPEAAISPPPEELVPQEYDADDPRPFVIRVEDGRRVR